MILFSLNSSQSRFSTSDRTLATPSSGSWIHKRISCSTAFSPNARSQTFGERECAGGLLGLRPTEHLLPLLLGAAAFGLGDKAGAVAAYKQAAQHPESKTMAETWLRQSGKM